MEVGNREFVTIQEDMDLALTRFIEHNRRLVFEFSYHMWPPLTSKVDNSMVRQLRFFSIAPAHNMTAFTSI